VIQNAGARMNDPAEKELVELVIDGMILGTAVFVVFMLFYGAWRHPWLLLAAWVIGPVYIILINWLDSNE